MPLPLTISCSSKIQIGFTFLVPAHPGSPGQRAVKRVCVCVCVCIYFFLYFYLLYQDCDELADWIAEKMLAARDDTYRDAKNAHSKWMRHQV